MPLSLRFAMPKKTKLDNPENSTPNTTDSEQDLAQFENSLKQLEQLVETLEKGELSLDQGLKTFEQGVSLARSCQKTLEQAELRVRTLMSNNEFDH